MKTSEILERAADHIVAHGWWNGGDSSLPGAQCASNAICKYIGPGSYTDAHRALVAAIGGYCVRDIFRWNDAPERTKEEVVAMLRAVAATERAREARLLPVVIAETVS